MASLFSGLESLGLKKATHVDIYENKEKSKVMETQEKKEIKDSDFLFLKTHQCPVCNNTFKSSTIKAGTIKLDSVDTDLRPEYKDIDILKYGVVVCPKCGYAALNQFFNMISTVQARLIKEQISASFKRSIIKEDVEISYEDAIIRHKLALLGAVVKKGKLSERAYTCLKTAWLLRGKGESLSEASDHKEIQNLKEEENEFLTKAYDGFIKAYYQENYPICGMDSNTLAYLLGDIARRLKKYEEAGKWISQVLVSKYASSRIKNKARELKELINAEK
jgi:uncharacterized protein